MKDLAHRHLQIDFHIGDSIPNIGGCFDSKTFGKALCASGVQSINFFAKCHHSWCYYPTKVGHPHPNLKVDLCGQMYQSALDAGVKPVIYFSVGWSEGDADRHPEWCTKNKDGSIGYCYGGNFEQSKPEDFRPYYLWKNLCINTEYAQHNYDLIRELLDLYPKLSGLFIDIMYRYVCYCPKCIADMKSEGVNIEDDLAVKAFYDAKWRAFSENCKKILFQHNPNASVFFNGGSDMNNPQWHSMHTHIEMEDLPTAWGGYDKMPLSAKYFARIKDNYLGMTGIFHKAWGEFSGYKNKEALKYEIAAMMSYGAGCCIGFTLHPDGHIDKDIFDNIKYSYDYAKVIEPYCFGAKETARVGVALTFNPKIDEGVAKVLLESHIDFDIILDETNLSERFDVIILPDEFLLDEKKAQIFNNYIKNGGKILATGTSGMNLEKDRFLLDCGLSYHGESQYQVSYVQFAKKQADFLQGPLLMYSGHQNVSTQLPVLAVSLEPYYNRTFGHFCGHLVVPYDPNPSQYPAAVGSGQFVYLSHKIFSMYLSDGAQWHRDYVVKLLKTLLTKPVLKTDMMSCGRMRLTHQSQQNRYVLHALYASPIDRGGYKVLEDFPTLTNTAVEIRVKEKIKEVVLQPQNKPLEFEQKGELVKIIIPTIRLHQIITIDY